jgi:lipopolysaccharide export system protein LptA
VSYFRNGFDLRCPVEGRTLRADSAHHFQLEQRLELFGNVRYEEGPTRISSQRMTYYRRDDRVVASRNVQALLQSGSTMNGDVVDYRMKNPPLRLNETMTATQRPTFMLVERDSAAGTADSTTIIAERIHMDGDQVFASGDVVIRRSDMDADADSLYGNREPDQRSLKLMRNPALRGRGANAFTMTGATIEIEAGADRKIERIQSLGNGSVLSDNLHLAGDSIDMFMDDRVISRAFVKGDSGGLVRSQGNSMRGKSLEIDMTNGKLAEIRSFGSARAELAPDTVRMRTTDNNFMQGDTITVSFEELVRPPRPSRRDSLLPVRPDTMRARTDSAVQRPDSLARPDTVTVPSSMLAIGNASMFYQRAQARAAADCTVVDYWRGDRISVTLKNNEINTMTIKGNAQGINSECASGSGRAGAAGRSGRAAGAGRDTSGTLSRVPRG